MSHRRTTDARAALEGPATRAAVRSPQARQRFRERPYPRPVDGDVGDGDAVVLAATRAMLSARTREEVAAVLHTAVNDLGGGVVPARLAGDALPLDVSLGVGEPRVVFVDRVSVAGLRLERHLPGLVQDALTTAARCDREEAQPRPGRTSHARDQQVQAPEQERGAP